MCKLGGVSTNNRELSGVRIIKIKHKTGQIIKILQNSGFTESLDVKNKKLLSQYFNIIEIQNNFNIKRITKSHYKYV